MITAIVMVNCDVDKIPEVAQQIADLEWVREVYSVTGDIDLIARVKVSKYDNLADVIADGMAKISGVQTLRTHVAFRTYSASDLDEAFHLGLD